MTRLNADSSSPFSVRTVCGLFGVSRQAFYKRQDDDFAWLAHEQLVVDFVVGERSKNAGIGGEKLWLMYNQRSGLGIGRDRFLGIVSKHGLLLRLRRSKRPQTTDSDHRYPKYPDLAKELIPQSPNELWASDITYITLSLITDCYTKEIVGYKLGESLEAVHSICALRMALSSLGEHEVGKLIHHSDRGVQYACFNYTEILHGNGIRISMTQDGNPKDNAIAERVNGILKNEILGGKSFASLKAAQEDISRAIHYYNNERPHRSLDMVTPAQAASRCQDIKKRWVSRRENHIKAKSVQ